jgi:hypothetical protein
MGRGMNFRLWYPQFDVYDAIRRVATILVRWHPHQSSSERLFILDFYFANPPLLHNTHMPSEIRKAFNAIGILRPEKSFVSYPSAQLLFHKMEPVQAEALKTLVGKGLLDNEQYTKGSIRPSASGLAVFNENLVPLLAPGEVGTLDFLMEHFAKIGEDDIGDLRRSTGLRRVNT